MRHALALCFCCVAACARPDPAPPVREGRVNGPWNAYPWSATLYAHGLIERGEYVDGRNRVPYEWYVPGPETAIVVRTDNPERAVRYAWDPLAFNLLVPDEELEPGEWEVREVTFADGYDGELILETDPFVIKDPGSEPVTPEFFDDAWFRYDDSEHKNGGLVFLPDQVVVQLSDYNPEDRSARLRLWSDLDATCRALDARVPIAPDGRLTWTAHDLRLGDPVNPFVVERIRVDGKIMPEIPAILGLEMRVVAPLASAEQLADEPCALIGACAPCPTGDGTCTYNWASQGRFWADDRVDRELLLDAPPCDRVVFGGGSGGGAPDWSCSVLGPAAATGALGWVGLLAVRRRRRA